VERWQADGRVRQSEPVGHTEWHGRRHPGIRHVGKFNGRTVQGPIYVGRLVQPAEDLHGSVPDHVRGRRRVPGTVQPGRAGPVRQRDHRHTDQVVRRLSAADEVSAERQRGDGGTDSRVQAARLPDGARPEPVPGVHNRAGRVRRPAQHRVAAARPQPDSANRERGRGRAATVAARHRDAPQPVDVRLPAARRASVVEQQQRAPHGRADLPRAGQTARHGDPQAGR